MTQDLEWLERQIGQVETEEELRRAYILFIGARRKDKPERESLRRAKNTWLRREENNYKLNDIQIYRLVEHGAKWFVDSQDITLETAKELQGCAMDWSTLCNIRHGVVLEDGNGGSKFSLFFFFFFLFSPPLQIMASPAPLSCFAGNMIQPRSLLRSERTSLCLQERRVLGWKCVVRRY